MNIFIALTSKSISHKPCFSTCLLDHSFFWIAHITFLWSILMLLLLFYASNVTILSFARRLFPIKIIFLTSIIDELSAHLSASRRSYFYRPIKIFLELRIFSFHPSTLVTVETSAFETHQLMLRVIFITSAPIFFPMSLFFIVRNMIYWCWLCSSPIIFQRVHMKNDRSNKYVYWFSPAILNAQISKIKSRFILNKSSPFAFSA